MSPVHWPQNGTSPQPAGWGSGCSCGGGGLLPPSQPAHWDIAIIDLFLRQGSGLGVLAACRNRLPHQRMVVLSNYATPDVRMRCAQLGVDAVFDKSNEIDDLVDYCIAQGQALPDAPAH